MLLVQTELSAIVIGLVAWVFVVGALDYVFRFPATFRLIILIIGSVLLVWSLVRKVAPAIRFRPSLVEMALRIERIHAEVRGRLASGIDLALAREDQQNDMARRSMEDVESRAKGLSFKGLLDARQAARTLAIAAVLVLCGVGYASWKPTESRIGIERVFVPFGSARWPARTGVISRVPAELVHPKGEPLIFAAELTKGNPESDRVFLKYRYVREGVSGPWQELQMTRQRDAMFERVLDTNADEIQYSFMTREVETPTQYIQILEAPSILSAQVTIEPPKYAIDQESLNDDLGDGTDRRSRFASAILEGSTARMVVELNRTLNVSELGEDTWIDETFIFPDDASRNGFEFSVASENPRVWNLDFPLREGGDLKIALRDEHGLVNLDSIEYRFDTVVDNPPSVTITEPMNDEAVSMQAVIPILAEARDDVQLAGMSVDAAIFKSGIESQVETLAELKSPLRGGESIRVELSVTDLAVSSGDEILIVAKASDTFEFQGEVHEEVRSTPRRLRIVGDTQIAEELRSGLSSIRRTAMQLEGTQADVSAALNEDGASEEVRQDQSRLSDQLASVGQTLDSIAKRRDRNRLEDQVLDEVLQQASDLIEAAERSSSQATESIEDANTSRDQEDRADAEAIAGEFKEEVQAELTDLAALLDRDEDAWVVTRRVQQMRERLQELMERTDELAEETVGRWRSDLSDAEREAIDDLSSRQAEESEEAQQLIEELQERAESLDRADPTQAAGLRAAAREAEQAQLESKMEEASDSSRNNQLQQANEAQQDAADALDRMLEEIEESRKARVEEIQRRIASLVDSLKGLVNASENELIALARLNDEPNTQDIEVRAREMIRINGNTLAVSADARVAGNEGARIARLVDRAARSQGAAIGNLRSDPPNIPDARDDEERGLAALKEALAAAEDEADRLADQQADEKRRSLMAAYTEIIGRESNVLAETKGIRPEKGARLGRRGLVVSRRLSLDQVEISKRLLEIRGEFSESTDSLVFSMTHRNIDAWSEMVSARLKEGKPDTETIDRESMIIESLSGLLSALDEDEQDENPFEEPGEQGGQAGSQPGEGEPQPLIPPIAELKALRAMQQQILDLTRRLDTVRVDLPGESLANRLDELSAMQSDLHGVGTALVEMLEMNQAGEGAPSPSPKPEQPQPPAPEQGEDL